MTDFTITQANALPLQFTVPGEPRGKGRPRFVSTPRGGRTYTDAQTASYENLVKMCARAAGAKVLEDALKVEIIAYFAPAASWSKKKTAAALANQFSPGKFDCDNIAKAVLDGLNSIAFRDDKQVADLRVRKLFAAESRLEVSVSPISPTQEQSEGVLRTKAA
jgi:Holliday junction resolvase RusA-like endonuclease